MTKHGLHQQKIKIYFTTYIKKNLLLTLRHNIDSLVTKNIYGKDVLPSKAAVKEFCMKAQRNVEMSQKSEFNINNVNQRALSEPKKKTTTKKKYFCEFCNRKGDHSSLTCFYNTNQEVAY